MGWVGDMIYSLGTSMVSGAYLQLPREPRDGAARPARAGAHHVPGAAAHLGDHADRPAGQGGRRLLAQAAGLSSISARWPSAASCCKTDGKPIPATTRLGYRLGEFFVYGPVRDQLGLRNARACLTGGAPLGADTFRFFRSFGVNLKQVYGATEACGLVSLQGDDEADPNTVGRTVPDTQVRIGERGEVEVKGPGVFVGYYKQEDATRDAMTPDGWLKTGDAGLVDPRGQLAIIDRAKDVGKLADGTPFAPQFIENKLKFSPFIREAVAFGDQRAFVAAMIAIDISTVGKWAEQNSLPYTSYMDLARKPEVARLIVEEVAKINATLPEATRVRRIVLLNKELDADDAEMTRTRKVRRAFVAEKYAPVIAGALRRLQGDAADHGHHLRGRPQEPDHLDHARLRRRPRRPPAAWLRESVTREPDVDARHLPSLYLSSRSERASAERRDPGDRDKRHLIPGSRIFAADEFRDDRCAGSKEPAMWDELEFAFALVVSGLSIGLMYSLIALGFVLVYKATDAINFAQGEFVMLAGLHGDDRALGSRCRSGRHRQRHRRHDRAQLRARAHGAAPAAGSPGGGRHHGHHRPCRHPARPAADHDRRADQGLAAADRRRADLAVDRHHPARYRWWAWSCRSAFLPLSPGSS